MVKINSFKIERIKCQSKNWPGPWFSFNSTNSCGMVHYTLLENYVGKEVAEKIKKRFPILKNWI